MIRTKQKTRKQISDLVTDLEIINPIESKSVLGGEWYDGDTYYGGWLSNVNIGGSGSSGNSFDNPGSYNPDLYGGYQQDWNNYGGDNNGGGGGSTGGYDYDYYNNWVDANGDGINDADFVLTLLPNLPTNVPVQTLAGACVPTNASFVASYLGSPQTPEFMMHEYALANNMNVLQEVNALVTGLGHDQQVAFLLQQFHMTGINTIAQMTSAIDNHHPVLAAIIDANGNGHEVTIVGYDNATGMFRAADTVSGGYVDYPYNAISLNILSWEITGVK